MRASTPTIHCDAAAVPIGRQPDMTFDISETLAPNSDQLDAIDLVSGPRTFTIGGVSKGNAEQPVQIQLTDFSRVWRPSKSMRRVLAACWGTDASTWAGRRVTLYCDPDVMFGKDKVGGTRISHLSHIDKPKSIPLLVSRGKSQTFRVQPLPDAAPVPANPNADLLAEIGKLADQLPGGRAAVAAEWADTHDGQSLRQATDIGGLELFRDDLATRIQ